MKYTGLNELRESYLKFFESKGHLILNSAPLVPRGDNSILLINAGMTPLKKYFQGLEEPPRKRAASCQKCIRTPDIENVGITARHGTFFEMLGNFSFGDYFKEEACAWAWEYFTKVLEIPSELLWVSVYEEDDEARDIWINKIGLAPERVVKFGKKDNFWEHGSGPCGPCSEIYFDRGKDKGCGSPDCKVGCECDRYIEVWNLVFTQFDGDGKGNYAPLAMRNIDTGMGLERLACVMQNADNLFEIDTVKSLISEIERISGKKYGAVSKDDVSFRVIADHIRGSAFLIGDGVLPSNEGRGYVLRRLLRRAARRGRLIGIEKPFLCELFNKVREYNSKAYPELEEKADYIKKTILTEEESFLKTVEKGLETLDDYIKKGENLSGEVVFKLHDTFGFPVDLTREILAENNLSFNEDEFSELMKKQKDLARANRSFKGGWDEASGLALSGLKQVFKGYDELKLKTKISALLKDGKEVEECFEGDEIMVILEETPFYAESGGQVGDIGSIFSEESKEKTIDVYNTTKTPSGLSVCHCVANDGFKKGEEVEAYVNSINRSAIMKNHTSAHLLQAALRSVLGEHVHQAGSLVDAEKCRFDFTHNGALTSKELELVEERVRVLIASELPVTVEELPIEKARERGAMALFGEKYGDVVRVVNAGDVSIELCGGTHVSNTSEIGGFKIVSEASAAAGVRRIEAVTGFNILTLLNSKEEIILKASNALKLANPANLVQKCEAVADELASLKKEVARLNAIIAEAGTSDMVQVGEKDGIALFTLKLPSANADALRQTADKLKSEKTDFVAVLAGEANFLCVCDKGAVSKGFHAGNIVKRVAEVTGGKGGGKPDTAMAGIGDKSKVDEAMKQLTMDN